MVTRKPIAARSWVRNVVIDTAAADFSERSATLAREVLSQGPVLGTYGANVALALGKRYLDGKGILTATFIVNKPTPGSTTGGRTLVTGTQAGTYTVNCEGTLSVGTFHTGRSMIVITAAIVRNGQKIAAAIADAH